jgi:CheY-like chemotaxis protein
LLLEIGVEVLKASGYAVLEARSGREAVEAYEANMDRIDLVILDIVLPDIGGGEVFDRIKIANPNAKVLLSSGYSIEGQATAILKRGCDGFLQKPFRAEELFSKMREILG